MASAGRAGAAATARVVKSVGRRLTPQKVALTLTDNAVQRVKQLLSDKPDMAALRVITVVFERGFQGNVVNGRVFVKAKLTITTWRKTLRV